MRGYKIVKVECCDTCHHSTHSGKYCDRHHEWVSQFGVCKAYTLSRYVEEMWKLDEYRRLINDKGDV